MNQYLKIDYGLLKFIELNDYWDIFPLYCVLLRHVNYSPKGPWRIGKLVTTISRPVLCNKLHLRPATLTRRINKLYDLTWIQCMKEFGKCNIYLLGENKELYSYKDWIKTDPCQEIYYQDPNCNNCKTDPGNESSHQDPERSECIQTDQKGSALYNNKDINDINTYLNIELPKTGNSEKKKTIVQKTPRKERKKNLSYEEKYDLESQKFKPEVILSKKSLALLEKSSINSSQCKPTSDYIEGPVRSEEEERAIQEKIDRDFEELMREDPKPYKEWKEPELHKKEAFKTVPCELSIDDDGFTL